MKIIRGYDSLCDECGMRAKSVVVVGEADYYESRTSTLCDSCIANLIVLVTGDKDFPVTTQTVQNKSTARNT